MDRENIQHDKKIPYFIKLFNKHFGGMKMEKNIQLGDEVQDIISGFTGIAMAKTDYMWGCTRFAVQPQEIKENKLGDPIWFDEPQLIVITKQKVKNPKSQYIGPMDRVLGGPQPNPKRDADPIRR